MAGINEPQDEGKRQDAPAPAPTAPATVAQTALEISATIPGPLTTQITPIPPTTDTPPISAPRESAIPKRIVRPATEPSAPLPEPVAPVQLSKRYSEIF